MPPSRRQTPPVRRRPKIAGAGIRRPSPSPRPRDEDHPNTADIADTTDITDSADTVDTAVAGEAPDGNAAPAAAPADAPAAAEAPEEADALQEAAPRRPSPRPKTRDAGEPRPDSYAEAEAAAAEPAEAGEPDEAAPRRKPSPYVLAGALFGLALVLAGFAVWFKIEDNRVEALTSNTALLDTARTVEVGKAASGAVESLFSYDYNNIAKTQNAAKDLLLNDDVRNTYNAIFGDVERLAPQQKIVVTVKATRNAVVTLQDDRAKVMVFVDQTSTRTDQNQTASGSAQLWLNMQYVDGKWKVSALNTYQAEQPPAAATPAPSSPAPPASPAPSR
ncbi:hypothetical protein [Amycolatopsis viridis]|uniref:Mce-associated membrane protein n=1 Tax=Amycolatopsis viridis TaxID=185678 RepID=A0ABX0T464_9PSEU|nr:hypothetical protein [Amycolatopsis viridis]NIH82705.1 Mce-associated membrane protein [Amycolatopsis viridis]